VELEEFLALLEEKGLTLEETLELVTKAFEVRGLSLHKALPWKGNPELLPPGSREGLGFIIGLAKACAGVKGKAIDPDTGRELPRAVLCRKNLAKHLKSRPEGE